jgi:hypothetical protein
MSLKKTAELETPHATFVNERADWIWKVLKVNRTAKPKKADEFASWFIAAKSPNTFGSWEYGDSYIRDVAGYGRLESSTDEFAAYWKEYCAS